MKARHRPAERRSADRPRPGDSRTCPRCGIGTIEFNERYRLISAGARTSVPAWLCDRPACGYRELVRNLRPSISAASLGKKSRQVRAAAVRTLMKSRAAQARAEKTLEVGRALLGQRK